MREDSDLAVAPQTVGKPPHNIVMLALEGVRNFEVAAACATFSATVELSRQYRVTVCGERLGPLITAEGYGIEVSNDISALARAYTVVVAGTKEPVSALASALPPALLERHAGGARVVALGTGVFAVGLAGILAGRRVTTHWRYAESLQRTFTGIRLEPRVLFVQDGDLFTGAGGAAALDLFVELICQDLGVAAADDAARSAVMAPARPGGLPQFIERPLPPRQDTGLPAVRAWMLTNLSEAMTVDSLAARAFMSRRQFTRVFRAETGTSVLQWLIQARVREARRLLESSDEPVERIGQLCGFPTSASFRMHFKNATGSNPSAYRAVPGTPARPALIGRRFPEVERTELPVAS